MSITRDLLRRSSVLAIATAIVAAVGSLPAQALDDKWCKDVHIRFFVGGAEGDAFGTIVYNGAKQAEADLGPKVDYIFSRLGRREDGAAASRGRRGQAGRHRHDGPSRRCRNHAARRAGGKAGIKMMYQNVPVPKVVAAFGGGYVGAQQEAAGPRARRRGDQARRPQGRRQGDHDRPIRKREPRRARARHGRGPQGGRRRGGPDQRAADREWASDPNLAIPVITAALLNNPDVKMVGYPGGQMLGNVPTYMQAAGKKPGEIFNFGFDTSPQIVEGFKGGWVQLTADQQPFLQGYLPILSLCQQVVLGLAPMNVDTGAGFVTPENYEIVAELAKQALR